MQVFLSKDVVILSKHWRGCKLKKNCSTIAKSIWENMKKNWFHKPPDILLAGTYT